MSELSFHTTVGVCETQPVTAAGVRAILESSPDLKFLWAASTLEEAVRMARQHPPRVVLADKGIGTNSIIHWILNLAAGSGNVNVVVWGSSMTEAEALRFVQAGARGVVRKAALPETLISSLRAAGSGVTWMEDIIFRTAPRGFRSTRSELTPRESQIFELVEQGLTNSEIARELGIQPGTVKIHLKHLYEKTGIRSRYHLALTSLKDKGILTMTA